MTDINTSDFKHSATGNFNDFLAILSLKDHHSGHSCRIFTNLLILFVKIMKIGRKIKRKLSIIP